jgi:hypothetical protein
MLISVALGAFICLIAALLWIALRRQKSVMANPRRWPPGLSRPQLIRYANHFLKADGWAPLQPWEYEDVRIRAAKPGIELNILVVEDPSSNLATKLRDASQTCSRKNAIVGLLTQQIIHPELRREAEQSGMFMVEPAGLPEVENAIRAAAAQHQKWRHAATRT